MRRAAASSGPGRDPGKGDQADALGHEVRQVRERQADDVEAQRRGREEQCEHHLIRAQHVDGREAGQQAAQPEGGEEPPVDGGRAVPAREANPADQAGAAADQERGHQDGDDRNDRPLVDHEQGGDADGVQRPRQQAQPVEEPQPEVALQQAQPVLLGEHGRHERQRQPAGHPDLVRVPVQDQQQPQGLEGDEEHRLGGREAEAEPGERPRGRWFAGDRVGERRGYPEVPKLGDHQGPQDQRGEVSPPVRPQHSRQKGACDHEDRLDREAGRDRQDRVALEPFR